MDLFLVFLLLIVVVQTAILFKMRHVHHADQRLAARTKSEAEKERLEDRNLLDALAAVSSDGMIVLDAENRILFQNGVAQSILRTGSEGAEASLDRFAGELDLNSLAVQVRRQPGEMVERRIAQGERVFVVRAQVADRAVPARVVIGLDEVTELQRLGRARRDFVANISHELRTPLTTLQVLIETISAETLSDRVLVLDLLGKMHSQIDLLRQLTDELMDLALIESGQAPIELVPLNVASVVDMEMEALRPQAARKGIELYSAIPADLGVLADPRGIRKVLGNLIHNAIKYTQPGGRVEVSVLRTGDQIEFRVHDTGIGISAKDLPRVFERFYKVSRARSRNPGEIGGTGLGLAIARHIVGAHGGKIWATSEEGKGSTFFFTLLATDSSTRA